MHSLKLWGLQQQGFLSHSFFLRPESQKQGVGRAMLLLEASGAASILWLRVASLHLCLLLHTTSLLSASHLCLPLSSKTTCDGSESPLWWSKIMPLRSRLSAASKIFQIKTWQLWADTGLFSYSPDSGCLRFVPPAWEAPSPNLHKADSLPSCQSHSQCPESLFLDSPTNTATYPPNSLLHL